MRIKKETITSQGYLIQLEEPEDWVRLKVCGAIFGLKINFAFRRLDFYNLKEGALVGDPVFSLGVDQLEELSDGFPKPEETMYTSLVFPSKLYMQVKERLTGLPIALPTQGES